MLADLLIRLLLRLSRGKPRVINGRDDASKPYLTRYFLTRRSRDTEGMDGAEAPPPTWGIYLHHFQRSDDDGALHNHPWSWAVSLVLKGGYSEERRVDDGCKLCSFGLHGGVHSHVVRRRVRPWTLNFLTRRSFHRIDLLDAEGAWTLFLVGPVVQSWGFWDRDAKRFTPWKRFLGVE